MPSPQFPPATKFLCCECDCDDVYWQRGKLYEIDHFAKRFVLARQVRVLTFEQDELDNIIARTLTGSVRGHEVTMTFDSGEPTPWICKHIIAASRLWARLKHDADHVLIHWQHDPKVVEKLKWAKHQWGDDFKPHWYRLDRNVFIVAWDDYKVPLNK